MKLFFLREGLLALSASKNSTDHEYGMELIQDAYSTINDFELWSEW